MHALGIAAEVTKDLLDNSLDVGLLLPHVLLGNVFVEGAEFVPKSFLLSLMVSHVSFHSGERSSLSLTEALESSGAHFVKRSLALGLRGAVAVTSHGLSEVKGLGVLGDVPRNAGLVGDALTKHLDVATVHRAAVVQLLSGHAKAFLELSVAEVLVSESGQLESLGELGPPLLLNSDLGVDDSLGTVDSVVDGLLDLFLGHGSHGTLSSRHTGSFHGLSGSEGRESNKCLEHIFQFFVYKKLLEKYKLSA